VGVWIDPAGHHEAPGCVHDLGGTRRLEVLANFPGKSYTSDLTKKSFKHLKVN
jgi:hypothetical protein